MTLRSSSISSYSQYLKTPGTSMSDIMARVIFMTSSSSFFKSSSKVKTFVLKN